MFFLDNVNSTIGVDILVKKVEHNGREYKLALTDTAGQERFKALSNLYFRGAKAIIFVYAINSRDSFEDVNDWISTAKQHCDNEEFIGCLIGNKLDLERQRQVSYEEGLELAQQNNYLFLEVSAKAKLGIDNIFEDILNLVLQQKEEKEMAKILLQQQQQQFGVDDQHDQINNRIDLTDVNHDPNVGYGGCC